MEKLTIFLLLTILVSISWAQISGDSATVAALPDELNGGDAVTDNEIIVDESTIGSGNGESLITVGITEQETTSGIEDAPNEEEQTIEPNKPVDVEQPTEAAGEERGTEANTAADEEQATKPNSAVDEVSATEPNTVVDEQPATKPDSPVDEEPATKPDDAPAEEPATKPDDAPAEEPATKPDDAPAEEPATKPNSPAGEQPATEPNNALDEEPTTKPNNADEQPTEPPATPSPPPACTKPGLLANEDDCHQYYECTTLGSADGSLQAIARSCPLKMAFSPQLNRCSRDIAACPLDIQCTITGPIADPAGNSSYYYCEKRYEGNGYFTFHINCESYQYYEPLAGKCIFDLSNAVFPPLIWNKVKDDEMVKDELKLIHKEYKMKVKAQEKLEKENAKKAKKQAKMEEKLRKEQVKLESAIFVCPGEGKFPSQIADNVYIQCFLKKTKLKAISMQCMPGTSFNPEIGACTGSVADSSNSLSSDDED